MAKGLERRVGLAPLAAVLAAGMTVSMAPAALRAQLLAQGSLPTVTVTAKGYAAEEMTTPASVTVIDGEALFERGANQVGDAVRGQPGLAVNRDGPVGQNPVIRALKKESIVLLVDGMRPNSAQPAGSVASLMSLGLADRIEVVKGPASVLYGTGALGGVLNVRLAQARFEPGIGFRGGLRYDSVDSGLRAAGVLNVATEQHALMIGFAPARVDDYEAPSGPVPNSGYNSDTVIGQYRMRLADDQQLRISAQWQQDREVWFPGSARPGTPPALGTVTVRSPEQERSLAEFGYEARLGQRRQLLFDARVYRQDVNRQIRAFSSALQRDTTETDVTFETLGADLRGAWEPGSGHLLSLGVNAFRTEASPERYLNTNPPLFNNRVRNDPFEDGRIEAIGVYVQDDLTMGQTSVVIGARYDRVEGDAASLNNGAVTTGLARTDDAVSGNLGLIFELTPVLRPFLQLARGFRAADLRERFESSPRGDGFFYLGNPQLEPETATQFEVGVKGGDAVLDYSLAAYRNRIDDYITGRVTGATMSGLPVKKTENIGRVVIDGIEGQLRWQAFTGQWLRGAFTVLRATNETLDEPLFQSPADELSIGWQGRVGDGLTADLTLRLVARQERVATVFARGTENVTPGYGVTDIGITWRRGAQQVRFAIANLFNKAYHEHLDDGVSGREPQAPGRNLWLSWQGRF